MTDYLESMANPNMTSADAVTLGEREWWKLYPARDVALAQLRQPYLCMPFGDLHRIVEEAIGGPVWTHEFARPEALIGRIETGQRGAVNPLESLAAIVLRRTRSGLWVTKGRRYRTKALAMRSRVLVVAI